MVAAVSSPGRGGPEEDVRDADPDVEAPDERNLDADPRP